MTDQDTKVRRAAFRFLEAQAGIVGNQEVVLNWQVLTEGFDFEGRKVPLVSVQGIFKPAILDLPLTIRTAPPVDEKPPPYEDEFSDEGLISYKYRGDNPQHRDNLGLRKVWENNLPLVYLFGLLPGKYLAVWPVFIAGDDPDGLTFTVAVDTGDALLGRVAEDGAGIIEDEGTGARRRYVTTTVKKRLHQHSFRERVLRAYREQCSVCRLRHAELLDAAHIVPDTEGGMATVNNGLALCKLHHAAFDRYILGVRPDLVVEIRSDILEEVDGPMLQHGLKLLHGGRIRGPRRDDFRPATGFLEQRYEKFLRAG